MKHIFSYKITSLRSMSVSRRTFEINEACDLQSAIEAFERLCAFENIDFSIFDKDYVLTRLLTYGEAVLAYSNFMIKFEWKEA